MEFSFYVLTITLVVLTFLPFIKNQHWFFKVPDFGRIQILVLQVILWPISIFFLWTDINAIHTLIFILLSVAMGYQILILYPYIIIKNKVYNTKNKELISILSVNVYQFNRQYQPLINLIRKTKPNIFITIETDQKWEEALSVFDHDYQHYKKIALDNTYGMHFYSNLKVSKIKTHYFVADDIPSIEVHITTAKGDSFILYGIHPPPASPTEEENSKEQDGELMAIAKKSLTQQNSMIVVGDFNSVAWSRITKLFAKVSGLIDARIGRGFISTFPAKYRLFKIPIDLVYHSKDITITQLKTLEDIHSDHLPLYLEFYINNKHPDTNTKVTKGVLEKTTKLIDEGINETSDNR
ncbi:hypothetical protein AXE80_07080 [Wenyingzhuangia fucanilytica]|uniref:Endonuclease/exonuclease/phosphatase domain-containing protein n=1 Tax=Wenyingzhuangia fucanilytica TaxID=1790137 RepID=A0A1B1Y5L6_9FLAO|nr:endonuclease/exonuclease/phosphatase family protein [Wenyingzhuangia fucanilytica]ANW96053.1 hypothetical protein AXE80_07080 [Wenyingzhuangia fucanilytica]